MTTDSRKSNALRTTHRLCVTLPDTVFQRLNHTSFEQGRSLSNLAAFLLEVALLSQSCNNA